MPAAPESTLSVNLASLITYDHRIHGIIEGDSDPHGFIPEPIELHHAGRFPFDRLIATYPLDQINQAIAAQANRACVRAVLLP